MKSICIIIPLYISDPSLYPIVQRCFDSLDEILRAEHNFSIEDYDKRTTELWICAIDDASPLPHDFPTWRTNKENIGFTGTVNRGIKEATKGKPEDVLIIMNDDIVLTQECFDRFKTLKGLQIASPRDTASSPDDLFGSCWGMTREAYELLGLLDEKYKHFFSDRDYYDRAKKAGIEIIKWNDIVLEHPESSTYKTLNKEELLAADTETYLRG